ncbi:DUF6777 domain-containing protein [Geodermatophilus nigrescens]
METFGPYQLLDLLGRGAMGEVHRALDTRRGRTVALKRLLPALAHDQHYRARFFRECRDAAVLNEAHVVPIHDFGEVDGRLFLDMRLVEGRDLGEVLAQDGPLSPQIAVAVVEQVAAALDAAHQAGIVHRDVKPSNVLVSGRGPVPHCYLLDFGIAGMTGAATGAPLTGTGDIVGSLDYLAPERLTDNASDPRVDVYSLACLLYEALTGRPPFVASDVAALCEAHLSAPPPRPSETMDSLPASLDEVVARGMSKDPFQRFVSAGALAESARAALTKGPRGLRHPLASMESGDLASAVRRAERDDPRSPATLRRLPLLASAAVALLALGGAAAMNLASGTAAATPVTKEAADSMGEQPFVPRPANQAGGVEAGSGGGMGDQPPAGGVPTDPVSGDQPGLYGGDAAGTCDVDAMVTFFSGHPAQAAAWAAVEGVDPTGIEGLLRSLTPVVLRFDTAVTNHGFSGGRATPFQSVLQAGTSVLVDERGLPRVRCQCGNPLNPPRTRVSPEYGGDQWPAFTPEGVVVVEGAPEGVDSFVVVAGSGEFRDRPVGTSGDADVLPSPTDEQAARAFVADPTVAAATSAAPVPGGQTRADTGESGSTPPLKSPTTPDPNSSSAGGTAPTGPDGGPPATTSGLPRPPTSQPPTTTNAPPTTTSPPPATTTANPSTTTPSPGSTTAAEPPPDGSQDPDLPTSDAPGSEPPPAEEAPEPGTPAGPSDAGSADLETPTDEAPLNEPEPAGQDLPDQEPATESSETSNPSSGDAGTVPPS